MNVPEHRLLKDHHESLALDYTIRSDRFGAKTFTTKVPDNGSDGQIHNTWWSVLAASSLMSLMRPTRLL